MLPCWVADTKAANSSGILHRTSTPPMTNGGHVAPFPCPSQRHSLQFPCSRVCSSRIHFGRAKTRLELGPQQIYIYIYTYIFCMVSGKQRGPQKSKIIQGERNLGKKETQSLADSAAGAGMYALTWVPLLCPVGSWKPACQASYWRRRQRCPAPPRSSKASKRATVKMYVGVGQKVSDTWNDHGQKPPNK